MGWDFQGFPWAFPARPGGSGRAAARKKAAEADLGGMGDWGGHAGAGQDLMDLPVKSSKSRQLSLVKSPSVSLRNTTADRSAGDMRTRAK